MVFPIESQVTSTDGLYQQNGRIFSKKKIGLGSASKTVPTDVLFGLTFARCVLRFLKGPAESVQHQTFFSLVDRSVIVATSGETFPIGATVGLAADFIPRGPGSIT